MVKKLHRYCTAEYTARNRSGGPVDLVDCCEQAGVLVLWTSLLNCTRSVRSQTGTKQEKGLLLLRALLSFFSNQAYKYLPPTHALLRLRSTKEDVGQLFNKAGQAPSPRTIRRYAKALVENHEKSISEWICEDLDTSLVLVIDDYSQVMISRLPAEAQFRRPSTTA